MHAQAQGNIIKMDRHSYVKIAYHGTTPLNKEQRQHIYGSSTQKDFSASQVHRLNRALIMPIKALLVPIKALWLVYAEGLLRLPGTPP